MPFSHVKIVMQMDEGADGFSEGFYASGSSIKNGDPADTLARALCAARKKVLCAVDTLHHFRLSAVEQKRVSVRRKFASPGGALPASLTRDNPLSTLVVGLITDDGNLRNYHIHGVPDDWTGFDVLGRFNGGVPGELSTYLDYIASGPFLLRTLTERAGDPGLKPITDITVNSGNIIYTVAGLGALVAGDTVLVSGVKGFKTGVFDGRFRVLSYSDPTLTVRTLKPVDPGFVYGAPSGSIRIVGPTAYTYKQITDWTQPAPGARKVGRPTDSHRGRASARR